jgi:phosphoglucosamine mutase
MISASHNSFADNGIKLFGPDGYKLSDEMEIRIETLMQEDLQEGLAGPKDLGRVVRMDEAQARYVEIVKATLPRALSLGGLRVVVDCANGAAYKVAPTALYELGAEVIQVGVGPNGYNINEECGSTHPAAMVKAVKEYRADIGLALDGDADRLAVCDEKGQVIDGDQIMALIASTWAAQGRLTGGGVVATVMSNLGLERFLGERGLKLERTAVGDRHVMQRMREGGFNVGGEASGHIILSDYSTTGDGLIAALQVLAERVRVDKPMSALARQFEPAPQKLENVRFVAGKPLENDAVKAAIAEGQARLNGAGRVLVRASGTEPLIRVMAEGDDEALVGRVVAEIAGAVRAAAAQIA